MKITTYTSFLLTKYASQHLILGTPFYHALLPFIDDEKLQIVLSRVSLNKLFDSKFYFDGSHGCSVPADHP